MAVDGDNQIAAEHDGLVAHVGLLIAAAQAGALRRAAGKDALDEDARSAARPICEARSGPMA